VSQECFSRWSESALGRPNFLCIGQPHAGADWLSDTLATHRDVRLPSDCGSYFSYNYHRGERWYLERFADGGAPRVGEIGPMYLYGDLAPSRIAAFRSIRKLVVLLRDPASWLVARYGHIRRSQRRTRERAYFLEHHGHELDRLCVHSFLALYLSLFDRDAFLFVTTDALGTEEQAVARRLADFLEIDSNGFASPRHSSRRSVLTRLLSRAPPVPDWLFDELRARRALVNEQAERLREAIDRDLSGWRID
jgi:Sulfotransferase domain